MEATRETGPLADAPVSGDVPTLLALAASPQDTLKTALGRLFSARLGAAHASPSRIGLQETMKALLSEQRGGKASSMLGSGGTRFSSEMLVRIARGVDAVGAGPPGTGRAKPRTEPSRTAGRGVVGGPGATVERRTPLAQERIERALITPATVTASSATAGIDLASITKTAMRSAGMAAPSRPLISPVSHAVATRAHLSKEDEAPEAAQAAQAAPAKKAETAPKSTPIDLDALAMELAGKISDRMQRDVERRGRW
jgi:hypothetical protein